MWTYEDRFEPVPSYGKFYDQNDYMTVQVACRGISGWTDDYQRLTRNNGDTFRMWWNLARERHVEYVIVHSFNQWVGPGEELD